MACERGGVGQAASPGGVRAHGQSQGRASSLGGFPGNAAHMCGFISASFERISLENRMKAFMGRLGAPSGRFPGVACCLTAGTSGVGETEGVEATVSSETEGESDRAKLRSDAAVAAARADRRMGRLAAPGRRWGTACVGSVLTSR